MDCKTLASLLDVYVDGETDLTQTLLIEQHLADCVACKARKQALADWRAMIRKAAYFPAPAGLRERLEAALQGSIEHVQIEIAAPIHKTVPLLPSMPRVARRHRHFGQRWMAGFASVAALLLFALNLNWYLRQPNAETRLATELVAAHVRSQLAAHLTDVVSSDQHTVKPWFNGRIDIAPPAIDLAAQGYALIGGRLDYIAGHGTAALVYRHHEHVLNVFVLPAGAVPADAKPEASSLQGFHLLRWAQSGLVLWVISDASESTLQGFAEAFKQTAP
ncbi:anti-sigma factor [Pseudolysobacter antarcticus]|uniref:Anti-sigma factor n=1 Tax=Pseudolysobacter antarcticus TaxID=2511995 RepID=A0A411HHP5_9GAMM|nr:zf-HC2 domain-containing protein [Pseudolysobacter antarcticus]QBB70001.1 anti-sigma factor [Pseudolysobacter antarcticus]